MEKILELINYIPKPLKNKYIITLILFLLWIIFIDDYNLIRQYHLHKDIQELQEKKAYYMSEINKDSIETNELKNSKKAQEKFAREKFFMRKDNEDLFIIRTKK